MGISTSVIVCFRLILINFVCFLCVMFILQTATEPFLHVLCRSLILLDNFRVCVCRSEQAPEAGHEEGVVVSGLHADRWDAWHRQDHHHLHPGERPDQ